MAAMIPFGVSESYVSTETIYIYIYIYIDATLVNWKRFFKKERKKEKDEDDDQPTQIVPWVLSQGIPAAFHVGFLHVPSTWLITKSNLYLLMTNDRNWC